MRDDGHGVSNERASLLLEILEAEPDMATLDPTSGRPGREKCELLSAAGDEGSLASSKEVKAQADTCPAAQHVRVRTGAPGRRHYLVVGVFWATPPYTNT